LITRREGNPKKVIIINAENAIVTGSRDRVLANYDQKYKLNHPRKGPFFPRMPDMILKRTVRGMLPYQKKSSGRQAVKDLRVMIGTPSNLEGEDLPEGHEWGDTTKIDRPLPDSFVRLGDISKHLGAKTSRWGDA
jgi:large subunit ribosomal protein L13|tara:strand:- start:6229 stop:6633 length:405 start_codon:yes stop_codon:yes gene_type:complete